MYHIAWTGHRPKDLPEGFNYQKFANILDSVLLHRKSTESIAFITGGALGIDTYAAEYAISRTIPFRLILPFDPNTMGRFWRDEDMKRLQFHTRMAYDLEILGTGYDVRKYQERNERMVNLADCVFTVWTGKKSGGTANCIRYARSKDKDVFNLLPSDGKPHRVREV